MLHCVSGTEVVRVVGGVHSGVLQFCASELELHVELRGQFGLCSYGEAGERLYGLARHSFGVLRVTVLESYFGVFWSCGCAPHILLGGVVSAVGAAVALEVHCASLFSSIFTCFVYDDLLLLLHRAAI